MLAAALAIVLDPAPGRAQPSLTAHAPIVISNDAGFSDPANNVTVGNGSFATPFLISDWNISATANVGIQITNTHKYFIIRNVLIHPTNFTPGSTGLVLQNAPNGRVEDVSIANFDTGIQLTGSQDIISTSTTWNNTLGISVSGSYNTLSNNQVHNNTQFGIQMQGSTFNQFTGNNASSNGNGVCERTVPPYCDGEGFVIKASSNNIFDNNTAVGNDYYGFRVIIGSNSNIFRNNNVSKNQYGLVFTEANGNQAYMNTVTNNLFGVELECPCPTLPNSYNNVTRNRITGNSYGISAYNSSRNIIYDNYLSNPTNVYEDNHQNYWNITETLATNILGGPIKGGNFYSNYIGNDLNGDGIGDSSYTISGNVNQPGHDLLPLVANQPTTPVHDIAVRTVTPQTTSARTGNQISITVAIFNQGTVPESFQVSVTYNGTIINNPPATIPNLPAVSGTTFTITWATSGLPPGTYQLKANATSVSGELYTTNNISPATTVSLSLNQPPTASFSLTPSSTYVGDPVSLDGSTSFDPDGTIANYYWNFGDGSSANGPTTINSYSTAGTYTVTLTVTDNEGATKASSQTITILSNKPSAPTNLVITATDGKPNLTWSPPANTGGSTIALYRIYRGTSNSSLSRIANTTCTNTCSYTDSAAMSGTTYYYSVSAVNQAAEGAQSTSQNVLVPNSGTPYIQTPSPEILGTLAGVLVVAAAAGILLLRRRTRHTAS